MCRSWVWCKKDGGEEALDTSVNKVGSFSLLLMLLFDMRGVLRGKAVIAFPAVL